MLMVFLPVFTGRTEISLNRLCYKEMKNFVSKPVNHKIYRFFCDIFVFLSVFLMVVSSNL